MADVLTPQQRSFNMSRIRGKDTGIEVAVRKYLFSKGYRYRKNDARYPGKPDIVLPKYKTVIFIHGCFWHRHEGCRYATTPKTREEFWKEKFRKNIQNDRKHQEDLESAGWRVLIIWECELKKNRFEETMRKVLLVLKQENQI